MNAQIYRMAIVHHEVYALFLVISILIILNLKHLKNELSSVKKKTWIMLALISMVALVVRMNVLHAHLIYQDEPYYGAVAKNMLLYNNAAITYYNGLNQLKFLELTKNYMGWSFILSIGYFLFGIKDLVAVYFTSVLGAMTIPFIFVLSQLLFNKSKVSLLAALFFSTLPMHIFWSSTSVASIAGFLLVMLILITLILYTRTLDNKLNLLIVVLLMFSIQVRPENVLLIPIIWMSYFIFIERFRSRARLNLWGPWILFIFLLIIYIPQLNQMFGYIGTFYSSSVNDVNISISIMPLLIEYNQNQPLYMLIFLAIGLVHALKRYRKETLFLGALYLITPGFFILWQGWETYRYFFINYYCIILLQSTGMYFVYNKLRKMKRIVGLSFIILIVALSVFFSYGDTMSYYNTRTINQYQLLTRVPAMIEDDLDENCYVVTNDEDAFTLAGGSLLKVMMLKDIKISIERRIKDISCLMYFEGLICNKPSAKNRDAKKCIEIYDYFSLEHYKAYSLIEARYNLYRLKLKK